ncbi:peptidase S8/S53 domain-containing protein [Catenaria anguillulae PL171]|uniref:Peptidase S8/S53 domain-containing protein n=1 Tax=Catenaria anguillulae PL171 TaxID=765915 RepID=A0A1Y2HSY2_9FUNG|nr:peptidase S8/S53 domain-containing protein [Catenaria anguillulae PL171]
MLRPTLGAALLAVLACLSHAAPSPSSAAESPLLSAENAKKIIEGHYMVVLKDDLDASHIADHHNWLSSFLAFSAQSSGDVSANRIKHMYDVPGGVRGYAGRFDEEAIREIRRSKHVAYVEQDQVVTVQDEVPLDEHTILQKDAPWGLSRISHRTKPVGAAYKEYPFPDNAGEGVSVYVIDTGINIKHVDFEGRARWGATIPENDEDVDGNGHGTHCAGTISGRKYGVAKKANAVAVKVLSSNGSGSMSDVVKGVEWAVADHKRRRQKDPKAKSAANMSLGGGASRTLDRVVNAAVDSGIHFAVAAGNDNRNACNYSPAAAEKAITVGATAVDDRMAWFSNVGKCVDIFGPGKDILSTWIGSNVATNTISGTSMASPHVAGVLAYLISQSDEPIAPKDLKKRLIKMSTKNVIKGLPQPGAPGKPKQPKWPFPWPPGGDDDDEDQGKTPNRLLFTGFKPSSPPKPVPEPKPEPPKDGGDENEETLFRILPVLAEEEDERENAIPMAVIAWIHKAVKRVRVRVSRVL